MNIHGNISDTNIGGVTVNKDFFDDYFDDENEETEENEKVTAPKLLTKGFLSALAVCLIAIGAALWTTIDNVRSYLNPTVTVERSSDSAMILPKEDTPSVTASEAPVAANISKAESKTQKDKQVVFNCMPVKNKKLLKDYSETPVYNETLSDYRAHTGLDFEADIDDKVRVMGKGVVKDIYYDDLLGNVVVVEHSESVESYYCGLARTALVQVGDVVNAGDFVGTVYAIPGEAADRAHVHVEVKENGRYVDPRKFMNRKTKNE